MLKVIIAGLAVCIFSTAAMAEKPEWAGNGKATTEQKEVRKSEKQAKEDMDEDRREGEKSKEHMYKNEYQNKTDSGKPKTVIRYVCVYITLNTAKNINTGIAKKRTVLIKTTLLYARPSSNSAPVLK